MDKLISNVKSLCERFPSQTKTYQELVVMYWGEYQSKTLFHLDFRNLASPESICRAYRYLVAKGAIQLDDEPRTFNEVLDSDNSKRKTNNKEEQSEDSVRKIS